jgi:glycosyltransferase involved in cell wall biosynthesis
VPARDVAALAEAIVALAMDQELRRRLGRQARAHIVENFSLERMAGRYLEICLHPS